VESCLRDGGGKGGKGRHTVRKGWGGGPPTGRSERIMRKVGGGN